MTEQNPVGSADSQPVTCILPEWDQHGLVTWNGIQTQKKSLNAQAVLLQPPIKVIPVIFLPGVMGTNLMSDQAKQPEAIWRGDSLGGVFFKWAGKKGNDRRQLLNPDSTKVDNRGAIDPTICSPFSDNGKLFPPRRKRGWGEVLSFSYGKFLSVFQGALLDDWQRMLTIRGPMT